MNKKLYVIAVVFLASLFSFQTIKSNTQKNTVNGLDIAEDLTAIDYRVEDNYKDFDALTD